MNPNIEANWSKEVKFLQELIRMPCENPPGDCAKYAERVAELLEDLGFEVERHPVPDPYVLQHGMKSVTNLIIRNTFGSGKGLTVALNAHGDSVPPGDGWDSDPYEADIRDETLYGRGSVMSKSDIAAYVFALLALKENNQNLNGNIEIHLTFDEERGGFVGPKWLLEHGLTKPDFAITAGMTHEITTSHAGCLHLEVVIRGKQAHAAIPDTGVDALQAASQVLVEIYKEKERLLLANSGKSNSVTAKITIGTISGGTNTNVVPDRVTFCIDRRLDPVENGEEVEAELCRLIENAVIEKKGLEIECRRMMLANPLKSVEGVEKLSNLLAENAEKVLNEKISESNLPLFTDARHYSEAGIPTVMYGAGPKSLSQSNVHGSNEHLKLSDLRAATEVIATTLGDLLSQTGNNS